MTTVRKAAHARRWVLVSLLLAGSAVVQPAFAACNPGSFKVNPNKQTVNEYDPASGYAPVLVTLGLNKPLATDGASATWTQTGGPAVTLNTSNPQNPTFLTPAIAASADLTFQATISCPGNGSSSDSGTVTVLNVNRPPVAFAQATPAIANVGNVVTLTSTGTNDPDGDTPLFYQWTRTAGPVVTLAGATTPTATFTAPTASGNYTLQFQLAVRDRNTGGLTGTATVVVNVTVNLPPLARLTCPESASEHDTVLLDGSTSSDPNGGTLSYQWTQLQGSPSIQVGAETGNTVQFTAPALTTGQDGFLEFQLKVTDSTSLFDLATCWVQIVDVTPPQILPPADITTEADSAAGKVVSYTVYAQDAVDDPAPYPLATCSPASGNAFPLAAPPTRANTTAVTCTAHDSAVRPGFPNGNVATGGFNITVQDTTPPVITVPGAFAVEATGPTGATASFSATTFDLVDGNGVASCDHATGSLFPLGTTLVTCNASDARLNAAAPANFNLTVHDTAAPTLGGDTADQTLEATSPAGAVATYAVTASDSVDTDVVATCSPVSGSTFALGANPVHCTATDDSGNEGTADFTITVEDTTAPTLGGDTADQTLEATSPAGAVATYAVTASDSVDTDVAAVCTPASGSTFALGANPVHCTATDDSGNEGTADFTVTVRDTTPPTIAAHGDVGPVEATSASGAAVAYTVPATSDIVDGAGSASCLPASGSTFALGSTTVHCRAQDAAGNHALPTSFQVLVVDTTAPVIAPHANLTAEATGPGGALVAYTSPSTSDAVDGPGTASCAPVSGSQFALGPNTVTCNAQDAAGNHAVATTFAITVVDTTPPAISAHADVYVNATGNSSAVATYTLPTATDLVSGARPVTCTPASGSTFALGETTIDCTATDAAGNTAHSSFHVEVGYGFTGFFRPIDNLPTLNVVKAGSAIPVKFSLGGNQGLNIFATGYPASVSTACNAATTDAIEETVTAGNSSLSYDAGANQYIYVWKTEKNWTGCRQLQVKLRDGRSYWAVFSFTR